MLIGACNPIILAVKVREIRQWWFAKEQARKAGKKQTKRTATSTSVRVHFTSVLGPFLARVYFFISTHAPYNVL